MTTLTVAGVEDALSSYKTVGNRFISDLNLVMPRLYGMGMWRDLVYETTVSTTDGNFTLPEGSESVLSVLIDNDPAQTRTRFHDYRLTGRNSDGTTLANYGIVDDGLVPTINELESSKAYMLFIEPIAPETVLPRTENNFIVITGLDNSSTPVTKTFKPNLDTNSTSVSSSVYFTSITEIKNGDSSLAAPVRAVAQNINDSSDRLILGDAQQANKVNSYRRYRVSNTTTNDNKVTLRLLVKRKFTTLINDTDPVYPSNLNAIKHGLLGMVAEDNADIERANYHWTVCKQLLEEELDSYRGAAKPVLKFDPSGSGSRVPNLL